MNEFLLAASIMVILIGAGTPIAVALGLGGLAGLYAHVGDQTALSMAVMVMAETMKNFILVAIPLYVLMGVVLARAGVGERLYRLFDSFLRHIPGGVGIATVLTCAVLAAMIGTSSAITAMVGAFALTNLRKYGYNLSLSCGILTAGGALGILIPPSAPMILYSSMTNESTAELFMSGVVPGVLAVLLFSVYVAWAHSRNKEHTAVAPAPWSERWMALKDGIWALLIPVGVVVTMYTGLATVTEAGAVGVAFSLMVGMLIYRTLRWKDLMPVLREATGSAVMIMFIIGGAMVFGNAVTQTGVADYIGVALSGSLPVWAFLTITLLILLVMGMFLEGASIMLILVPLVLPTLRYYKLDLIWFAVILVIMLEVGLLTPPVGLNLFVMDGVAKSLGQPSNLGTVSRGALPFILLYMLVVLVILAYPPLVHWLLPSR